MIKLSRIFLAALFLIIHWPTLGQSDSTQYKSYPRMGFSDLNVGVYSSYYGVTRNKDFGDTLMMPYTEKYALGLSVRFQASFLDFYLKQQNKKLEIVDLLGAELMVGGEYGVTPNKTLKPWYGYRFDAGFGAKYKFNPKNEIGLNVILLKAGTDNQSTYFIGSNIGLRYRYSKWMGEALLETRLDRFLGFFWVFQSWYYNPVQLTFQVKYLMDKQRNFGIRVEYYSSYLSRHVEKLALIENQFTLRVFYGIYF